MAEYCEQFFGERLLRNPLPEHPVSPIEKHCRKSTVSDFGKPEMKMIWTWLLPILNWLRELERIRFYIQTDIWKWHYSRLVMEFLSDIIIVTDLI